MFIISCLSSIVSSGNFFDASLLLNVTAITWKSMIKQCKPRLTYLLEVVGDVTAEDHLDDDLSDVPVLGLTQKFEDIVLRVEEEFEGDGAMVVLKDGLIVVAERLGVTHGDQKGVIHSGMLDVLQHACKESTHDVQIAEVGHQVARLREVMEVSSRLHDLRDVVVAVLLVSRVLDAVDQRNEVLVRDRELFEKAILLEEVETEVFENVLA